MVLHPVAVLVEVVVVVVMSIWVVMAVLVDAVVTGVELATLELEVPEHTAPFVPRYCQHAWSHTYKPEVEDDGVAYEATERG